MPLDRVSAKSRDPLMRRGCCLGHRAKHGFRIVGRWRPFVVLPFLAAFLLPWSAAAQPLENLTDRPPKPFILEVQYDQTTDLVSIQARHATLDKVLQEISERTHLTIDLPKEGVLWEQVSVEMKGLSLEQALSKLLREFNSAFLYAPPADSPNRAAAPRLIKVILFSKKARRPLEVRTAKEETTTESKSGIDPKPAVSQGAELVRAVLEQNSLRTRGVVEALKEPGKEREREKATDDLLETLLDKLKNNDLRSYSDALGALKELAPEKVVRVLSHWLQVDDTQVRQVAAVGMGFLRDERAIEPLVSALTGTDPATRQAAANAIITIGGQKALDALFRTYVSGDNGVKRAVAVTIAADGDRNARETLATLMAAGHTFSGPPLNDGIAKETEHTNEKPGTK